MEAFPVGLRVLVVDDDPTWLKILEKMLRKCYYEVTTCGLARVALDMLRERRDRFDIVISDVNMPDMDGFKLLEQVGLEMDLPVIMMSVDGEISRVMKGVQHGACDYLLKPIRMKELKNIWQHVFRKKINEIKGIEHPDGLEEFQLVRSKSEHLDGRQILYGSDLNSTKKRKDISNKELAVQDIVDSHSVKKARVVWSVDLHQNFVNAVNQIGYDKVGPKKILDLMNVPGLSREKVASHLQKYRLYLSRLQKQNEGTFCLPNSSESLQMSSNNIQDYSGRVANNNGIVPEVDALDFECVTSQTNSLKKFSTNGYAVSQNMGTKVYVESMHSPSGIQEVEHKLQKMHSSSGITQDVQHRQQSSLITNDSNPAIPLRKCLEKRQDFLNSLSEYQHLHQLGVESAGGYTPSLLPAITTGWAESFSFPVKTGDHRSGCATCLPQPESVIDSISIKVEKTGDVKSTSFSDTPRINGPSHAKSCYPDQYLIDSTEYTSQKIGSTGGSIKDVLFSIQDNNSLENLSFANMDIFRYDSLDPVAELQGKIYEDFQLECDYNLDFMDYPTTGSSLFA